MYVGNGYGTIAGVVKRDKFCVGDAIIEPVVLLSDQKTGEGKIGLLS